MRLLILWAAFLMCITGFAQGSAKVNLTINAEKGGPLSGAKVTFKETMGLSPKVEVISSSTGTVSTTLSSGREWSIFINGFEIRRLIAIPDDGERMVGITLTYAPETYKRLDEQVYSRDGFFYKDSEHKPNQPPPNGFMELKILVETRQGRPLPELKVGLVSVADKTVWTATTDRSGLARFYAKANGKYDVDIESALNVNFADMPEVTDYNVTETVQFQPLNFTQTIRNDTITQNLNGVTEPPSGYQYFMLEVQRSDGTVASNENVFLSEIHGQVVYKGKTNARGIVEMMLPARRKYMLHFNYQVDVDVVDLSRSFGRATRSMFVTYIPNPRLEHPELFIPGPDQIFLKEFDAFITRQLPKANKRIGIHLRWGGEVHANSKEAVLEIGVNAQKPSNAPRLNVSFVMDNSGSMAGHYRIERLKDAMMALIPKLPDDANISLITYSDNMVVRVPPIQVGTSRHVIMEALHEIQPGGGTNMLEAMQKGYQFVKGQFDPKAVNMVIILSDGWDANEISVLEKAQKGYPEIECSTVGIGQDFNYALLKILAENGKGRLFYCESEGSFDSVFVRGMLTNLTPAATDVSVEVAYNDRVIFRHLYGYKPENASGNPAVFRLPSLYPGGDNFAIAKFDLLKPDSTIEKEPVTVTVKYYNPESGKQEVVSEKVYLKWNAYEGLELIADAEMKKVYAIAVLNQAIKVMADNYAVGDNNTAQATLQRASDQIKELYPDAKDKDVKELLRAVDEYLVAFRNLAKKNANR